jgi:hypothetical protein
LETKDLHMGVFVRSDRSRDDIDRPANYDPKLQENPGLAVVAWRVSKDNQAD